MTTMGDRWTHDQVDELFYGAPIHGGMFDYLDFTRTLKHGAKEKDDEAVQGASGTDQKGKQPSKPPNKQVLKARKLYC